jgi:hypothetical protein
VFLSHSVYIFKYYLSEFQFSERLPIATILLSNFFVVLLQKKTDRILQIVIKFLLYGSIRSYDSAVGIATGVRVPVGSRIFSSLRRPDGSGAHPASYLVDTVGPSPGVKRQGREAGHSPPTCAKVKKMWIYTSTPPYAFTA